MDFPKFQESKVGSWVFLSKTRETEAGRSGVGGWPGLRSEFQASSGYRVIHLSKINTLLAGMWPECVLARMEVWFIPRNACL